MDILVLSNCTTSWKDHSVHCALGRSGIIHNKWEGDGGTPIGLFPLRRVFYRRDRLRPPLTSLDIQPITPTMGWCDDPKHADYNRLVELPHPASCESLWREDEIYDVIVVLGHNDDPVVPNMGSAIFLHLARPDFSPTQGCVALALPDLLTLLADAQPGDSMIIRL